MEQNKETWLLPKFSEKDPAHIKGGVEVRCPGPAPFRKLFLVLRQEHMPQQGMYMEIACADCAKWAREHGAPGVKRFLHYYDATGKCVSNKVTAQ